MSVERTREFCKTMTRQEVRLWWQLRLLKADGFHFRRQVPLLGYYPDFACLGARLIVEVDGGHHDLEDQANHDLRRDAVFTRVGFQTLRFRNEDVDKNLDGVVNTILDTLAAAARPHPSASRPPSP